MPTGYTATLHDGEPQTFPEFAMACARNFGALVLMRDDPADAEVPEFQPQTRYHDERLAEAQAMLEELATMTPDEAQRRADADYEEAVAYRTKSHAEADEKRERYEAMRAEVEAWSPPTVDHENLKTFMVEQLDSSIRFDCSKDYPAEPVRQSAQEWVAAQRAEAFRTIEHNTAEREKEIARTEDRNRWVKALRASLETVDA